VSNFCISPHVNTAICQLGCAISHPGAFFSEDCKKNTPYFEYFNFRWIYQSLRVTTALEAENADNAEFGGKRCLGTLISSLTLSTWMSHLKGMSL
jgi:hypothetical protein